MVKKINLIVATLYSIILATVEILLNNYWNDFIRLRISKEDKEVLQDIATKNRMSLSSYVRTRILNKD